MVVRWMGPRRGRSGWVGLFAWLLLCAACAQDGADSSPGPADASSGELYAPERVLEVAIELSESDWDLLRYEGRTASQILSGCAAPDFEYTRVPAVVTIDGERFDGVEIRKKGYLGSLSAHRPSLKIDLAPGDEARRYQGADKLTLNNNLQDASNARTCLSYRLFERAGVHAPRCNFAHVVVNGEDLGTYSHVEGIDKPFLARSFGDDSGNLYEGQGADFRSDLLARFQKKTNERAADSSDLAAVVEALEAPDAELLAALESHVDVDAFIDFWAMEVLLSHWDGYNGDLNNYYVYAAPPHGRFVFIPWGTDSTFAPHAFYPKDALPNSVLAVAELSRRLYGIESTRERYRARLSTLLGELWDETSLLAEVDRIATATSAMAAARDGLRGFIGGRRAALQPELDGPAPDWSIPRRPASSCVERSTPLELSFAATFAGIESYRIDAGAQLSVQLQAVQQQFSLMLSSAGSVPGSRDQVAIRVLGRRSDNSLLLVQISLPSRDLKPGTFPTHGLETGGAVIHVPANDPAHYQLLGFVDGGMLELTSAGTADGAPVEGSFTGKFTPF